MGEYDMAVQDTTQEAPPEPEKKQKKLQTFLCVVSFETDQEYAVFASSMTAVREWAFTHAGIEIRKVRFPDVAPHLKDGRYIDLVS